MFQKIACLKNMKKLDFFGKMAELINFLVTAAAWLETLSEIADSIPVQAVTDLVSCFFLVPKRT